METGESKNKTMRVKVTNKSFNFPPEQMTSCPSLCDISKIRMAKISMSNLTVNDADIILSLVFHLIILVIL